MELLGMTPFNIRGPVYKGREAERGGQSEFGVLSCARALLALVCTCNCGAGGSGMPLPQHPRGRSVMLRCGPSWGGGVVGWASDAGRAWPSHAERAYAPSGCVCGVIARSPNPHRG